MNPALITNPKPPKDELRSLYIEATDLVNRLHRRLGDVVGHEFKRMQWYDINSTQALMLFSMGKDADLTASEISERGHYHGTNASFSLNHLEAKQYITRITDKDDRRRVRIRLTPKGEEVVEVVGEMFDRHLKSIEKVGGLSKGGLEDMCADMGRLERFWHDAAAYKL